VALCSTWTAPRPNYKIHSVKDRTEGSQDRRPTRTNNLLWQSQMKCDYAPRSFITAQWIWSADCKAIDHNQPTPICGGISQTRTTAMYTVTSKGRPQHREIFLNDWLSWTAAELPHFSCAENRTMLDSLGGCLMSDSQSLKLNQMCCLYFFFIASSLKDLSNIKLSTIKWSDQMVNNYSWKEQFRKSFHDILGYLPDAAFA
jgi:hypothetical protein